jgi:hypothetical protein
LPWVAAFFKISTLSALFEPLIVKSAIELVVHFDIYVNKSEGLEKVNILPMIAREMAAR